MSDRSLIVHFFLSQVFLLEGTDELKGHIGEYFSNLFSSEVPQPYPIVLSRVKPYRIVLSRVKWCVTHNMDDALLAPFT